MMVHQAQSSNKTCILQFTALSGLFELSSSSRREVNWVDTSPAKYPIQINRSSGLTLLDKAIINLMNGLVRG